MAIETLYLCSTPEELDSVQNSLKENLHKFVTVPHSATFRQVYGSENPLELQLCPDSTGALERKISSVEILIKEGGANSNDELDMDSLDDEIFALITHVMSEHEDLEYFSFLE